MSSFSSFSATTSSTRNFIVTAANQSAMTDLKMYLCPKCNNTYDLNLRSNIYVGRVPLILMCNHTMCEECIRISFNKREVVCVECQQPSVVVEREKRKIQEVFPVNFYLMGVIYYSKPNMSEISKLSLRPAGVSYKNRDRRGVGSNSSVCSEPSDVWSKTTTQTMMQEKCSQSNCHKSAVLRCADCVEVYCQSCCQTLHRAARGLQTHKITPLSGDFALELSEKCSLHIDNILEFQCNTCEKMICAYCLIQSHQNHNFCQLTYLDEPDRPNFETLVQSAEEKLKRLMFVHKQITSELEQTQGSNQTAALEASVAKYFANLHGRLQILEKKLREDANNAKNTNSITLNEISNELLSNIRTLYRLINTARNVNDIQSSTTKFNVSTIIERLENSLALPCYLVGQQRSLKNIEFVYGDMFNNLEENFAINIGNNSNGYQLVTEDELPEGYDTTLPSEISSIDISDYALTPTKSDLSQLSVSGILKSPKDLTPRELLTNALQPKSDESSSGSVADWVQNVTEESRSITNVPVLQTGDREYVTVTHIDHPECFYVQRVQLNKKLQNFSREIDQHVRNFAPVLKSVELNKLYIVKYEIKDARPEWYRGRVINIISNKNEEKLYNVLFIDYGNTRVVNINMLRKINSTLAKPRPFALQCKLFNIYPLHQDWDANAVKLMAQILTGKIKPKGEMSASRMSTRIDVLMVVMNNSEAILEVDLVTLNNGHLYSTREALIFVGHAVPCLNIKPPIDYMKSKAEKPMARLHTRMENFRKEQKIEVILSHVIDPYNIYIQIADYVHHIEHLGVVMTRHYNKPGKGQVYGTAKGENIYVPKKDMIVAVRFIETGSLWYRGIVKKTIDGQGMVEVFLVDYGNTATIPYTDIRRLSERFRNLDCQAILMKMADITPLDQQKIWNQNAKDFLLKYVANKDKLRLIIVEPQKQPKVALFECYASMDICINAVMVKEELAVSTGKMSETVEWIKENAQPPNQEPSYVHELLNTIQCSKKTYKDDSDSDQENANKIRKQVRVLLSKSPDVIYVACDDERSKNEQHDLHCSLQDYYGKHHGQTADWQVGDTCVVHIRAKKQYFRAIILEKIDDINFKVMLRDIAEEIVVSKGNIFILDNQFKKFREGTFRCHLTGVAPAGDSTKWSCLAIEFLQDVFTKNNDIYMTKDGPVDKNRKSFPVIMWYAEFKPGEALEPSRFIDHNINKLLIKKGLALRERPKPVIESDLDTKGGDTLSETAKEICLSIYQNQLSKEKLTASIEKKQVSTEASLNDDIVTSTKTHKNLKDSKNSKAKGHPKTRTQRGKQTKLELPKTVEESFVNISSEGEWLSASSSDEGPVSAPRRRKSAGYIEPDHSYQNLERVSASATSSPQHLLNTLDAFSSNTDVKRKVKKSPVPGAVDWNELIEQDESPKPKQSASAPVAIVSDSESTASAPASTALAPASTSTNSEATDWLPPRPFEKNDFFAYSTFVDYQACIYLHEAELELVLKTMEEKMKPVFDEIPPEPQGSIWVPGQLCTVRYFINESWYRGKIVSVGEETIKVLMIDYGNEEECKHEDLRFKVMYLDVPAFAKKICLYNVFPKQGSKWLTSDLDELHKKIVENKIFVSLKRKVRPGIATPAVIKFDNVNINDFMLENSKNLVCKLKQVEQSETESDDVIIEEEDSDNNIEHQSANTSNSSTTSVEQPTPEVQSHPITIVRQISLPRAKYCHHPLPTILEGQKVNVAVISILNYNKFIFEILTDQNITDIKEQFESISEDIKEVAHKQTQLTNLEIGQACVTKYSEDDEWYRGEVINFDDDTVCIWFVDFGNFETVPKDTVRAILPKWLMLPVLQYVGTVHGIELADDSYLGAVLENMTQYCGTVKPAEILSTDPLYVRLYNDDNDALAYQDLIDKKMLMLKD